MKAGAAEISKPTPTNTNMKLPESLSLFTITAGEKPFRKGFLFASGAFTLFSRLVLWVVIISFLLKLTGWFMDDSDSGRLSPSGMRIHTDAKTGVQYLSRDGALIPRLHADGSLVTKPAEK